jgi:dihydrofolate synthase/folylpolyglutamate synthase
VGGPDGDSLARVEAALSQRWPENKLDPSLERIRDLLGLLGDPHRSCPVVHIAGTNGKTSTARLIDGLLREAGLRTGLMTSPHLDRVTERISLHGAPLDEERFVAAYDEIAPYLPLVDARHPDAPLSFFEVLTALGFVVFADAPVDVAVVEVGMGGSWDATNVVHGEVCVVTPIGLDHADYLGDTVEEVAAEKAGIVKRGSFLVLAHQEPAAAEVVLGRAAEVGATVAREGREFGVRHREVAVGGQLLSLRGLSATYDDVVVPLFGAHQAQNAACALAAVEALIGRDGLDPDVVRAGFLGTTSPGRLEVVRRSPTVLVDAAHNPHGGRALAAALRDSFAFDRLVGVVSVLGGKDVVGLLEELDPVLDHVVVTVNSSPRALPAEDLAAVATEIFGPDRVSLVEHLPDAVDTAIAVAEEEGTLAGTGVLATGSVVTAADVRRLFGAEGPA